MNNYSQDLKSTDFIRHKQRGFTMVELLVVIAIIGIGAAIAIPSFKSIIITTRISSALSNLQAALQYARSEAIRRGVAVTLCKSNNIHDTVPNCDTSSSANGADRGWGSGWIVFVDRNMNGNFEPAAAPPDQLVQVQNPIYKAAGDGSIIPIRISDSVEPKFITFTPTGQSFTGVIRFQFNRPANDSISSHDKFLCLSTAGRWRVSSSSCNG